MCIRDRHYNPTGVQTDFTFNSGYTVGLIDAYLNGVKLIEGIDYTASDGSTVGLPTAAISLDTLELVAYKAFNLGFVNSSVADFNVGTDLVVNGNATFNGTVTGATVGVSSAGTSIGNAKTLNFIGLGNTFAVEGDNVNISIAGGGGGGLGTALSQVKTEPASQIFTTPRNATISAGSSLFIDVSAGDGGVAFTKLGRIHVAAGATLHVGSGSTLAMDVLNLFL